MTTHPFDTLTLDDGGAVMLLQRLRPKALQIEAHLDYLENWRR